MKTGSKKLKNVCSIELCGVEPGEIKEFETQNGVLVDASVRARIKDGGFIEVKVEKPIVEKKG